ncbi:MAG: ROK family protein [Armatimonadota bacterium]|nr:ROK family protein [Armatimonadota bacterium]
MNDHNDYAIGIDLGGTQIKTVAVTPSGEVLAQTRDITEDSTTSGVGQWRDKVRQQVAQLQRQHGAATAIGLAAPGLAAPDQRSIAFMPGRMQGLEGLDWTELLQSPHRVTVLNDAHAALLGEVWKGAAAGFRDVILLTLGTGVGGAILADGKLLRGTIGRAGHLGHICLNPDGAPDITGIPGSLEDAIGDCTLPQRSAQRFASTRGLIEAYRAGDGEAAAIWLKSVHELACGIASLINVVDPEAVIIGGGMVQAAEALFEPLQGFLDRVEWRPGGHAVKILPAQLGDLAGALGAAYFARNSGGRINSAPRGHPERSVNLR